MPLLAHFRRKMVQLYLWTKIPTKQWLVFGASAFQCMRVGFLCPKCNNFACLHTRQDQNELHLKRIFFFAKIGIFCKSIEGPLSESKTHWMSTGFNYWTNWTLYGVISRSLCKIRLRNVQLLRTTVNWCWCRFTHTFCHSSKIPGCMYCFWLSRSMRMPVSFTFLVR